jgi:hypothetical protein
VQHNSIVRLFNLLAGETKALSSVVHEREKQALIVEKFSSSASGQTTGGAAKRAPEHKTARGERLDLTVSSPHLTIVICTTSLLLITLNGSLYDRYR